VWQFLVLCLMVSLLSYILKLNVVSFEIPSFFFFFEVSIKWQKRLTIFYLVFSLCCNN
jgi:hypothetical protein